MTFVINVCSKLRLEFDIIEIEEPTCNKSPVVFIENNLGLEKWCVPHLYCYAYKHFFRHKVDNYNRAGLFCRYSV